MITPPEVRRLAFHWGAEHCGQCPLRKECTLPNRSGRTVRFHPYELELRAARELWETPEARRVYRRRAECERLGHRMTRHGARRARAWGLAAAHLQVHVIAAASNLALLALGLGDSQPSQRVRQLGTCSTVDLRPRTQESVASARDPSLNWAMAAELANSRCCGASYSRRAAGHQRLRPRRAQFPRRLLGLRCRLRDRRGTHCRCPRCRCPRCRCPHCRCPHCRCPRFARRKTP
ncbi:MAG: hypothetical protein ACJAYU_001353 [Bradymonadia bacterium]